MGMLDGRNTFNGQYGRVWPEPQKPKRRRFCAWYERGMDIRVKHFPTRRAAHDWLTLIETRSAGRDQL